MIFSENAPICRTFGLKITRFRDFRLIFRENWKFPRIRSFKDTELYHGLNERYWLPLSREYKLIRVRINRKKVRAHRKWQKVRKSQKWVERNDCKIWKNIYFAINFYILKLEYIGLVDYQIWCCLRHITVF